MANPKAIITKTKKKLRVGMAVFNKKLGIYEWQIREGGKIIHRESVEEAQESNKIQIGEYKATMMRDRAQATLNRIKQQDESDS